jgi:hypothetical protein
MRPILPRPPFALATHCHRAGSGRTGGSPQLRRRCITVAAIIFIDEKASNADHWPALLTHTPSCQSKRSSQSTPEQNKQDNDRQRHPDQPQQRTFSETHDHSPFAFVGKTRDISESSKSQANSDGERI